MASLKEAAMVAALVVVLSSCSLTDQREQPPVVGGDSDGDMDTDGDSDDDVEMGGDGDADSDGESDSDADGDSDMDGDGDADEDSDEDTDDDVEVGCTGDEECDDEDDCTEDTCDADGVCHYDPVDADGDDYVDVLCSGDDCDDTNPTAYPGATELCDDADNDCDGEIDEGVNVCGGTCPITTNTPGSPCDGEDADLCEDDVYECDGLNATVCSTGDDNVEVCNGVDDDCNGVVDEGCPCSDGETRECGSDVGECETGLQTCDGTGTWGDCDGGVGPIDELCDEADNDCDGTVDEGDNACGGVCELVNRPGSPCDGDDSDLCADDTFECDGLNATVCSMGEDNVELCNGLDDDCDGATDEGGNACGGVCTLANAPETACDGADSDLCADDTFECDGLNETVCSVSEDDVEVCEGAIDEDCDGRVDEGCSCTNGATLPCGTDEGECVRGTQTCSGGRWSDCEGGVTPVDEGCNGRDDDCDGTVDEGANACGGVCSLTNVPGTACDGSDSDHCTDDEYECSGLNTTACSTSEDTLEVCDGAVDEDCDGEIDEGVLPSIGCRPDGVPLPPESGLWVLFCFPDSRRRDLWVGGQEDGGSVASGWSIACTTTSSSTLWCGVPPALATYDTIFFDVSADGTWTCPTSTPVVFNRGRQLCATEIRTDRSPVGVFWTHGTCYFSVRP
jgi:hypothetical protein